MLTEQELIEKMAEKALISESRAHYALSALPIPLPVLLGLINGELVAVPVEASEDQRKAILRFRNSGPDACYRAMIEARPK